MVRMLLRQQRECELDPGHPLLGGSELNGGLVILMDCTRPSDSLGSMKFVLRRFRCQFEPYNTDSMRLFVVYTKRTSCYCTVYCMRNWGISLNIYSSWGLVLLHYTPSETRVEIQGLHRRAQTAKFQYFTNLSAHLTVQDTGTQRGQKLLGRILWTRRQASPFEQALSR